MFRYVAFRRFLLSNTDAKRKVILLNLQRTCLQQLPQPCFQVLMQHLGQFVLMTAPFVGWYGRQEGIDVEASW